MAETPSASDATPRQAAGLLCPACRVNLLLADRQGIEIDYCPQCRGVWLDRGELDKIIERNAAYEGTAAPAPVEEPAAGYAQPGPGYRQYDDDRHGESRHGGGHGGRREGGHGQRGGFLGSLFGH